MVVADGIGVLVMVGCGLATTMGVVNGVVMPIVGVITPVEVGVKVGVAIGGLDHNFKAASRLDLDTICGTPPGINT